MSRTSLTDIEQLTLLAIARIPDGAYGIPIQQEIEMRGRRRISLASVYDALDRLEKRGLVAHRLSEPTPERGGRARKLFEVEAAGAEALVAAREIMDRMWDGLELPEGELVR